MYIWCCVEPEGWGGDSTPGRLPPRTPPTWLLSASICSRSCFSQSGLRLTFNSALTDTSRRLSKTTKWDSAVPPADPRPGFSLTSSERSHVSARAADHPPACPPAWRKTAAAEMEKFNRTQNVLETLKWILTHCEGFVFSSAHGCTRGVRAQPQ